MIPPWPGNQIPLAGETNPWISELFARYFPRLSLALLAANSEWSEPETCLQRRDLGVRLKIAWQPEKSRI